jgi:hypothetical protein
MAVAEAIDRSRSNRRPQVRVVGAYRPGLLPLASFSESLSRGEGERPLPLLALI